jgi:hypothetical protein
MNHLLSIRTLTADMSGWMLRLCTAKELRAGKAGEFTAYHPRLGRVLYKG